jgi:hypothetical protein
MRHIQGQDHVAEQLEAATPARPSPAGNWLVASAKLFLLGVKAVVVLFAVTYIGSVLLVSCGVVNVSAVMGGRDLRWLIEVAQRVALALAIPVAVASLIAMAILRLPRVTGSDRVERLQAGHGGEQAVLHALGALDDRWAVFSGVVVNGMHGDIDHVVVGPPGVVAIETNAWSGSIRYDDSTGKWTRTDRHSPLGQETQDPAAQVGKACKILQRHLGTRVLPVVVFAHPTTTLDADHPTVYAMVLSELVPWLLALPSTVDRKAAGSIERRLAAVMES